MTISIRSRRGAALAITVIALGALPRAQEPAPAAPPPPAAETRPADAAADPFVYEALATRYRYEADGRGAIEQDLRVRIQSELGLTMWGQIAFAYMPASQAMRVATVDVHKPGGAVVSAGPSAITEAAVQPGADAAVFQDLRQMMVTVPSLAVGDTLVVRVVRTVHTPIVAGHFWLDHEFTTAAVVRDEVLEIDLPSSMKPTLRTVATAPAEASGLQGAVADGRRRYRWTTSNAVPVEPDPPHPDSDLGDALLPDVRLSTFADWPSVAAWYAGLARPAVVVDDAVRAKARELTAGATTDDERMQRLYDFVARDIRYVSLSFGLGRYAPHPAPEVLINRYGDCKDKHTLLAALLQAVGIEARPALANLGRRIDPSMPSPAEFNHVVTVVPRGATPADWIWLDTTPAVAPFGMLVDPLRDRDMLAVDVSRTPPKGTGIVRTPFSTPFERFARVDLDGEMDALGIVRGTFRQTLRGDVEVYLRTLLASTPAEKRIELARATAEESGLGKDVNGLVLRHLDTTRQPLEMQYAVRGGSRLLTWKATGAVLKLPVINVALANTTAEAWKERPRLQLGSPFSSTWRVRLKLPAGYRATLPAPVTLSREEIEYRSDYRFEDGAVVAERVLRMKGREVLADAAPAYLSFVAAVRADEAQTVALTFDAAAVPAVPADATADEIYRAAYAMYEHKRDQQAVTLAKAITERDGKHGSAWDLLGSAYRRLGQLDASIDAFKTQVTVKPFHDRAHSHLASALSLAGRRDEAIAAYAKHVEIAPLDGSAFGQLGRLLLEADRFGEAIPRLERAAALTPNDAWAHARLGAAHAGTRDAAKARAAFEAAIRLSPTPPLWTYAGWHLAQHVLEPALASELARKTLTGSAERMNGLALSAAGSAERDLVERIAWSWATVGLLEVREGRVEQAERYLAAAQVVLDSRHVAYHLDAVRKHLKRQGTSIAWDPFWRAAGGGAPPAGRARVTVLVGADGKVIDARVDHGADAWRTFGARLAGAPLPLALPDATFTRLPIELDLDCQADSGGCRARVALKAWQ